MMVFAPEETAVSIGWTPKKESSSMKRKSKTNCVNQEEKKSRKDGVNDSHTNNLNMMKETISDSNCQVLEFGPQLPEQDSINQPHDVNPELPPGVMKEVHHISPLVTRYTFVRMQNIIQHISIVGRGRIRCLERKVNILGFCIDADDRLEIYIDSPAWMSALSIEPIFEDGEKVVIEITSLVEEHSSFDIYHPQKVRSVFITEKWNQIASNIIHDCQQKMITGTDSESKEAFKKRILVCGAKGVGKSTYVRYMTNRLLSCKDSGIKEVAILDCDVGQTELSPPGLLSLTLVDHPIISPSHAHMVGCDENDGFQVAKQHEGACFYGFTTSKTNPESFVSSVDYLMKKYNKICEEREYFIPLVVNTDGWVKGLGYEILSCIINSVNAGHIVQLIGSTKAKFFDLSTHASSKRHVYVAETSSGSTMLSLSASIANSRNTSFASMESLEGETIALRDQSLSENLPHVPSSLIRNLRLCCYFLGGYKHFIDSGALFQYSGIVDDEYVIANSLASKNPYIVPFDAIDCYVIDEDGIIDQVHIKDANHVKNIFNSSIVGLCGSSINDCFGLGIVRSVDIDRRIFYVLTPLDMTHLQVNVKSMVKGQLQIPLECTFRGEYSESFPFICCEGVSVGIGSDSVRKKSSKK